MLLLFPCPGTILVASCPACFPLSTPSTSTPMPSSAGDSAPSPSGVGQREEIIAVSRLKACMAVDATPGSPRCRVRPPGPRRDGHVAAARPGGPAATKRVPLSYLLVSSPSQQEHQRIRSGTVFSYPTGRFLHAPGWQLLCSLYKGGTHSASINRL